MNTIILHLIHLPLIEVQNSFDSVFNYNKSRIELLYSVRDRSLFVAFRLDLGQGIALCGCFDLAGVEVGVDLGRAQALVTEYVLQDADIDVAVLIHEGRRGMAELMDGISL